MRASAYTPNLNTDDFFNDIPTVVATSTVLSNKTATDGVADATDITFASVAAGS